MSATGWRRTFASLENRRFRLLWFSMLASFTGLQMGFLAQGALTYHLEGNATSLGIVMVAWGAPQLVFSLLGGVVADRISKRTIIIASQATVGLLMLTMAVLIQSGTIALWHIALTGLVQGTAFAFNIPARQAWIPEIVGRERLTNAVALHSAGFNATSVAAPSLAGGLIAVPLIGFSGVYYLMAGCFFVAVALLLRMSSAGAEPRPRQGSVVEELGRGLNYIQGHATLRTLLVMGFVVIVLGMPHRTLLPVFAGKLYEVGSVGLGAMYTATGVGAVLGSLLVAYFSDYPKKTQLLLGAGLGFGAALLLFGGSPWFSLGLVALGLVGLLSMGYIALNNTLVLGSSEPEFYGRVQSVYMLNWSVLPFATMPVAALADVVGAQVTVAGTGALVGLALLVIATLTPGYRRLTEPATAAASSSTS